MFLNIVRLDFPSCTHAQTHAQSSRSHHQATRTLHCPFSLCSVLICSLLQHLARYAVLSAATVFVVVKRYTMALQRTTKKLTQHGLHLEDHLEREFNSLCSVALVMSQKGHMIITPELTYAKA